MINCKWLRVGVVAAGVAMILALLVSLAAASGVSPGMLAAQTALLLALSSPLILLVLLVLAVLPGSARRLAECRH